jgi:biopolymer transport protein ExbD
MKSAAQSWFIGLCLCTCAALGCDEKPEKAPVTTSSALPATEATATPKPAGPPEFEIDTLSAKVGFERALLDKPDGRTMLQQLLKPTANFVDGQDVTLLVDRSAKLPWVVAFLDELGKLGAKHVIVKTETRKEFSGSMPFTPELSLKSPPDCSVVAMVLEDRGTAVWKLSGGVATKHGKGMAGPDLSMTGDNIQRFAKGCKQSSTLFVSAGPSVEWGLAYDLAASSKTIEKASFDAFVLLEEMPVPGHKVALHH